MKKLNLYTTHYDSKLLECADIQSVLLPIESISDHSDRQYRLSQLPEIIEALHQKGKQGYAWFNRFFFDDEVDHFRAVLKQVVEMGVDGIAYMDLGISKLLDELQLTVEKIYISDPSVTNSEDLKIFAQFNDKVLLGRELTTEELVQMARVLPDCSLVSIYGHQVMSISRRPLLSAYGQFVGIDVDQHKIYMLKEEHRQEPYMIYEDETSASIYDGRVLLDFVDFSELIKAGMRHFVIESFNRSTEEIGFVAQLFSDVFYERITVEQAKDKYQQTYPNQEITTGLRQIKTSDRKVSV